MQAIKGIPPAWDYNPSTWEQRIPLLIVDFLGFCIAFYMGLYQIRLLNQVWDPFFGKGTENVLNSALSKKFPLPNAFLGAFGYILDVVTGLMGGVEQWKTKPWIVLVFGLAVGPLGLVSILLVIAQPLLVHA